MRKTPTSCGHIRSERTIQTYARSARAFLHWLVRREILERNPDVHHAARMMSAGHGGQVLLSQTTRDLVEHELPTGESLRDLGAHRLKDLQQKSHLSQLVIADLPADFPPLKTLDTHPNNL
jgi:hypothetical protein